MLTDASIRRERFQGLEGGLQICSPLVLGHNEVNTYVMYRIMTKRTP
jgi:hypothetical protein